jgi:hypothetical protein
MRKPLLFVTCAAAVAALSVSTARADESAAPAPAAPVDEAALDRPGRIFLDDLFGMRMVLPTTVGVPLMTSGLFGYRTSTSSLQFPGAASLPVESKMMWLAPTADVLASRNVTLGAALEVQRTSTSGAAPIPELRTWSYGVRPRIGYLAPVGRDVAVWPRLSIGYAYAETESASGPAPPATHTWLVSADVALMFRLGRYAYFNLGPALTYVRTRAETTSTLVSEGFAAGGRATFGLTF